MSPTERQASMQIGLFDRLRELWSRMAIRGRFRNPEADFKLSEDRIVSYTTGPAGREQTGPYVCEEGDLVALHMVGDAVMEVHSIMSRENPGRLMLSYTEIMMGVLRFVGSPRTIGMIGLGGGSLVKHCYYHLPHCRITVAEISPEVVSLRRSFYIPDDDERLQVRLVDGAAMVQESAGVFDVLMIDAFDGAGYPPHMGTRGFYKQCRRALSDGGVLVVNLSGAEWTTWCRRLNSAFRGNTVLYQCPDGDNIIAFATKNKLPGWISKREG